MIWEPSCVFINGPLQFPVRTWRLDGAEGVWIILETQGVTRSSMSDKPHLKCPEVGIRKENEGDKTSEHKNLKSVQEFWLWEPQKKQNSIQVKKRIKNPELRCYKWERKAALKNPTMKKWRRTKARQERRKYGLHSMVATRNWKTQHRKCVLTEQKPQMNVGGTEWTRLELKILQTRSSLILLLRCGLKCTKEWTIHFC